MASDRSNFEHFIANNKIPQTPQAVGTGKPHDKGAGLHSHTHSHHVNKQYDPLKIPCDWELAAQHALARRTAPDIMGSKSGTCPCCGFEIERQSVSYWDSPKDSLSFLGSGFPLFFNFVKFCVIILVIQITIKGVYNLKTNYDGKFCAITETEHLEGGMSYLKRNCPDQLLLRLSLANKMNNTKIMETMSLLTYLSTAVIMIVLLYFRKSQKALDAEIDESQLTPADYTLCVKNIPTGLDVEYDKEIRSIFENYAVLDSEHPILVRKVVLVYNIDEIIEKEEQLNELIEKKKEAITKAKMDFNSPEVEKIDHMIEEVEQKIHHIEQECADTNKNFCGIAFISFDSEAMKSAVKEQNNHTGWERFHALRNNGKTPGITQGDLSWNDQKLFVEDAPEPNDVNWEFIHVKTHDKIWLRIRSYFFYALFEASAFLIIYIISIHLAKAVDEAHEKLVSGHLDNATVVEIKALSYSISFLIILFNKFCVASVLHKIVDSEKISNCSKFQISFAYKYSVALFMNAAMISFTVDIVILKNVYGDGGFIFNESIIFILNAFFPPLVWLLDPWFTCKKLWLKGILANKDKAIYTQAEANKWMEQPDYLSAKRYSDIIKTMWFTFLYGTAIPLGPFVSCLGLVLYYHVDKYNLLYRRTVKESISIELSNQMIEMLEYIVFFGAMGEMTMSYSFFKKFNLNDMILMVVAILYMVLPMEDLSDYLFPVQRNEEVILYEDAEINFDTDYDRENPILKKAAIKVWNKKREDNQKENINVKDTINNQEIKNHQ